MRKMRRRGGVGGEGGARELPGVLPPGAATRRCYLPGTDTDLLGIQDGVIFLARCLFLSCLIRVHDDVPGLFPQHV